MTWWEAVLLGLGATLALYVVNDIMSHPETVRLYRQRTHRRNQQ